MPLRKRSRQVVESGVAAAPLPGQAVSGDGYVIKPFPNGVLVAAIDGLGHGPEASAAARIAAATLEAHAHESALTLVKRCHDLLRQTRGVVMTLASLNVHDETLTWAGVGNVEGVLVRAETSAGPPREYALLHGGVVGLQIPPLRGFVIPVAAGDTLILATDGIRSGFAEGLPVNEPPQQLADLILARDAKGTDDALVVVARYRGGGS